jgi:hypothetical protein
MRKAGKQAKEGSRKQKQGERKKKGSGVHYKFKDRAYIDLSVLVLFAAQSRDTKYNN